MFGGKDTSSLFGDMLGIGPIMEAIKNPDNITQAMAMVRAVTTAAERMARLEYKIDLLLTGAGHDVGSINARFQSANGGAGSNAAPLIEHGPAGTGGRAAPGGVADHGSGAAARNGAGIGGGT